MELPSIVLVVLISWWLLGRLLRPSFLYAFQKIQRMAGSDRWARSARRAGEKWPGWAGPLCGADAGAQLLVAGEPRQQHDHFLLPHLRQGCRTRAPTMRPFSVRRAQMTLEFLRDIIRTRAVPQYERLRQTVTLVDGVPHWIGSSVAAFNVDNHVFMAGALRGRRAPARSRLADTRRPKSRRP